MTLTTPTFPHRKGGHCGSSALRDLLELHGLDFGAGALSEGAAFGLGGGLGFLYTTIEGGASPIYLVGRTAGLETDIAAHLEIPLDVRATDDPDEGWEWVRALVDAGRPPMVWADIAELPYLNVRLANTRHDIVIAGYDEAAGIAWVADNDREELQPCSLESLAAARSSSAFPGPNRHTTFDYDWPERLPDPRAAVAPALARAIANMREHESGEFQVNGAFGLAGVDLLARDYADWPARHGDRLADVLSLLSLFIVKAGTGGAMFRSLHAEFLRDMGDLLEDDVLKAAAGVYDDVAAAWVALAQAARAGDHAAGAEPVAAVARLEHEGVAAMERYGR